MAFFYCYETWPCTITLQSDAQNDQDPTPSVLEDYSEVIVSFSQGSQLVELSGTRLAIDDTEDTISFTLTQAETGKFRKGSADVQVNVLYIDTERDTSAQGVVEVRDNLHKKVMSNE